MFSVADGIYMVEFRRGRGDVLAYHSIYKRLGEQLSDLRVDSAGGGGAGVTEGVEQLSV